MASGTEKRQRPHTLTIRLSDAERDELNRRSRDSGLAAGAFLRAATLGDAGPRAKRRPPLDHVALRQALGELGRVGNNLNQIARQLNSGELADLPELKDALASYLAIRNAIFEALGMQPGRTASPSVRVSHDHQRRKPGRA